MDFNQHFQLYNFYQGSPQHNQSQNQQQSQQRPPSNSQFFSSLQGGQDRSIQPSPAPQTYQPMVVDLGAGSPGSVQRVMVPAHQSYQSPTVDSQQSNRQKHQQQHQQQQQRQHQHSNQLKEHSSLDFVAETLQQFYLNQNEVNRHEQIGRQQETARDFRQDDRFRASQHRPLVSSHASTSSYASNNDNRLGPSSIWSNNESSQANLKTPMALVVDIAKRHKINVQYHTTSEQLNNPLSGEIVYTVCLQLGNEQHLGSGNSISRAQQNAAQVALRNSSYISSLKIPKQPGQMNDFRRFRILQKPAQPRPQNLNIPDNREASMTPTVELNALAMKFRLKVLYEDHQSTRAGSANTENFMATCKVGNLEFRGSAQTRKEARQASAKAALEDLRTRTPDQLLAVGVGTPPNLQSEISQIYDFASRRGLSIKFEVEIENPLPNQTFITVCTLSGNSPIWEIQSLGRGKSKKEAKHRACVEMLKKIEGRNSSVESVPPGILDLIRANNAKNGIARQKGSEVLVRGGVVSKAPPPDINDPNFLLDLNPISRIFQIFQAKKNGVTPAFEDDFDLEEQDNTEVEISTETKPTSEISPTAKVSLKPTENGKYVLMVENESETKASTSSKPISSESEKNFKKKPKTRRNGVHLVRCKCGDKTIIAEAKSQKLAKAKAAREMLELLGYNILPEPELSPSPSPLLEDAEKGESGRNRRKKRGKSETAQENAESNTRVQLYFHPALFAPPKSSSMNPSCLLTAKDLVGNRKLKIEATDITIIAKKLIALEEAKSMLDLIKMVGDLNRSKIEPQVLDTFERTHGNEELATTPNLVKLKFLCSLTGLVPDIETKLNNSSYLVFVNLVDAIFCGEGASRNEAVERVAARLLDNIASTVLPTPSPQIGVLTEQDLVPVTDNLEPEVLPTALMVEESQRADQPQ